MKLRRLVALSAGALLVAYGMAAVALFTLQRRLLFPAPSSARTPPDDLVHIPGPSGPLFAIWHRAPEGAPTVVHFHGNAEQLADSEWLVQRLVKRGLGAASVEYPGYGLARDQDVSQPAIETSTAAFLQWLRAQGVDQAHLVLEGWSLGSGVAAEMAHRGFGKRLVLVSPFTSIPDVAQRLYPIFPASLLVRDPFNTLAIAPEISEPVLVIHGTNDDLVPFRMGERLVHAFPDAKLRRIEGRGHENIFDDPRVIDAIVDFARANQAPEGRPGG